MVTRIRHALLCGVSDCGIPHVGPLPHVDRQVERLRTLLTRELHPDYRYQHVVVLDRDDATPPGLRAQLKKLATMTRLDEVLIYLSGHGMTRDTFSNFVARGDYKRVDEILALINAIRADVKVALFDFCHAGELADDVESLTELEVKLPTKMGLFAATKGTALTAGHGPFTDAVIDALTRAAASDGLISWGRVVTQVMEAMRDDPYGVPVDRMSELRHETVNRIPPPARGALDDEPTEATLLTEYLDAIIRIHELLDPDVSVDASGSMPLDEVYLSLRAEAHLPGMEVDRRALEHELEEIRQQLELQDNPDLRRRLEEIVKEITERVHTALRVNSEDVSLHALVKQYRRLVILGEPGAGKTTSLRYLALQFARAIRADVARFVRPNWWDDEAWAHPDLGAVRLPILLPISRYAEARRELDSQLSLIDYLATHLTELLPSKDLAVRTARVLTRALDQGRAIVLLDGLDELTEPGDRRQVASQITVFTRAYLEKGLPDAVISPAPAPAVADFPETPRMRPVFRTIRRVLDDADDSRWGNRFVVTSRIAGYSLARLSSFRTYVICRMTRDAMRAFLHNWMRARQGPHDAEPDGDDLERRVDELCELIAASPGVERLAENPLLLRLIALVQERTGAIPRARYDLYESAARAFLIDQNYQNSAYAARTPELLQHLGETQLFSLLGHVALSIHRQYPSGMVTRDELTDLVAGWMARGGQVLTMAAAEQAREFVRLIHSSVGILVERAGGYFGFLHRTFAEFFTAYALNRDGDRLTTHIREYLHVALWREPLLLAIAAIDQSAGQAATAAILDHGSAFEELLHRDLLFAADCICERDMIDDALVAGVIERIVVLWADRRGKGRYRSLRLRLRNSLRQLHATHGKLAIEQWLIRALRGSDLNAAIAAHDLLGALDAPGAAVVEASLRCNLPLPAAVSLPLHQSAEPAELRDPQWQARARQLLPQVLVLVQDSSFGKWFARRDALDADPDRVARDLLESGAWLDAPFSILLRAAERARGDAESVTLTAERLRAAAVDIVVQSLLARSDDADEASWLCELLDCGAVMSERFRTELGSDAPAKRARALNALLRLRDHELMLSLEPALVKLLTSDVLAEAYVAFTVLVRYSGRSEPLRWAFSVVRQREHPFRDDIRDILQRSRITLDRSGLVELRAALDDDAVAPDALALLLQRDRLVPDAVTALLTWLDAPAATVRAAAALLLASKTSSRRDLSQYLHSVVGAGRDGRIPWRVDLEQVDLGRYFPRLPPPPNRADGNQDAAGADEAIAHLRAALDEGDPETIQTSLEVALVKADGHLRNDLGDSTSRLSRWLASEEPSLAGSAPDATTLAQLLDSPPGRARIAGVLLAIRHGLARYLVPHLAEAFKNPDERISRRAIWSLWGDITGRGQAELPDELQLLLLRAIHAQCGLEDHSLDPAVCCGLRFTSEAMMRGWLDIAGTPDHPDHGFALWCLARVGHATLDVQRRLADVVRDRDRGPDTRGIAAHALGTIADHRYKRNVPDCPEVTAALVQSLADPTKRLRDLAAITLEDSATPDYLEKAAALLDATRQVADPETRVRCLHAMGFQLRQAFLLRIDRLARHVEPAVLDLGINVVRRLWADRTGSVDDMTERLRAIPRGAVAGTALDTALAALPELWASEGWQAALAREDRLIARALDTMRDPEPAVARAAAAAVAQAYDVGPASLAQIATRLVRSEVALRAMIDAASRRKDVLPRGTLDDSANPFARIASWVAEHAEHRKLTGLLVEELARYAAFVAGQESDPHAVDYLGSWIHVHGLLGVLAHLSDALPASALTETRPLPQLIGLLVQVSQRANERVLGLCIRILGNLQQLTVEMVEPILACTGRQFSAYMECRAAVPKFRRFAAGSVARLVAAIDDPRTSTAYLAVVLTGELAASRPEGLGTATRQNMAGALAGLLHAVDADRRVFIFDYEADVKETVVFSDAVYGALEQTVGVAPLAKDP